MTGSAKQSRGASADWIASSLTLLYSNDGMTHYPKSHLKLIPPAGTLPPKSGAGWTMSTFEHIIVESKGAVGIITLNRPKMLNALSFGVFREIAAAVDDLEADD
jgi:hypothetical protein